MAADRSERLRFAPSPTGSLHLGNARTALVNWLLARGGGGTLVLRIEDTDLERHVAEAEAGILGDLRWLGIDWDEGPDVGGAFGPYRQSQRREHYGAACDALWRRGAAYWCFCDPDALRRERDEARASGEGWRYSGRCAALDRDAVERRRQAGEPAALRLRVPDQAVHFVDGLRGSTGVQAADIDDFVVARSDGSPTYLLAAVVDDHLMAIDHVVRGQDHLSNTPKQLLLYAALGWKAPRFSHLPLVLGGDRARLSKRHGATSVADMRDEGVVPEALVNYLALLGWGPPEQREIFSPAELTGAYRLADVSSSNVAFDVDKLLWVNQQHLLHLPPAELLARAAPFLAAVGLQPGTGEREGEWWCDALALVLPSCHRLAELAERLRDALWGGLADGDAADLQSGDRRLLELFVQHAEDGHLEDADAFRAASREVSAATGCSGRGLFHPLRVALTGQQAGPELARLVPLLQRGSGLSLRPPLAGVAERLRQALAALP